MTIHETIGSELQRFGGHLECLTCGKRRPLGPGTPDKTK